MITHAPVQSIPGIDGLFLVPDSVTLGEETALMAHVDALPWSNELKRRVQHYGYRYDYKKRRTSAAGYMGVLPDFLLPLAERLHRDGFIAAPPDQSAVNEYLPGQGIATHVDCIPCFGDTVLAISLGSPCVMDFSNTRLGLKIPILLEQRSLLVMAGPARYEWRHGIAPRKTDVYNDRLIRRGRRISVTFRKTLVENLSPFRGDDPPPLAIAEPTPTEPPAAIVCRRLPGF